MIAFLSPLVSADAQASQVTLMVTAVYPSSPVTFSKAGGAIFLRIHYTSDVPIIIDAVGYRGGQEVRSREHNLLPTFSGRSGDALCWFAYKDGAEIDEIRISAERRGAPVASTSIPFAASWTGPNPDPGSRPVEVFPEWTYKMDYAQNAAMSNQKAEQAFLWYLGLPAILIVLASFVWWRQHVGTVLAVIVAIPFGWFLGVLIARIVGGPNFGQLPIMTVPVAIGLSIVFAVSRFLTAWTRFAIMLGGTVALALVVATVLK